jgi:hypothetical protein
MKVFTSCLGKKDSCRHGINGGSGAGESHRSSKVVRTRRTHADTALTEDQGLELRALGVRARRIHADTALIGIKS